MKQTILNNSTELLSSINESFQTKKDSSNFIATDLFTVAQGRGTRKNQLMLSVCNKGEYTINIIFNTDTLEVVNAKPLGKYSKEDTNDMANVAYWLYSFFIKSILFNLINKLNVNETIEVAATIEQVEVTEDAQQEQTTDVTTQSTNDTNTYTVANRSFTTYQDAEQYCFDCDYDPNLMIQEVAIIQLSDTQSDTLNEQPKQETYQLYKETFNTYSEAYNHACNNDYPTTMILSSTNKTITNERLQQLELEYTFSKRNMSYDDMNEYYNYILTCSHSSDKEDRQIKLKSWINHHEAKQERIQQREKDLRNKAISIDNMLKDLYSIGMTSKEYKSLTVYTLNNKEIYKWSSGITTETMYTELLEVHNNHYKQTKTA